ncbi:unnamed protein product [Colias eurytheme]|nr:unnamed protein product [Colias eurytheme]
MDDQFQLLFESLKIETQKQTIEIQTSVTNRVMEILDVKLKPIIEENKILKIKLENLEKDIESLKRSKKQKNLVFFGLKEDENSNIELLEKVKNVIKTDLGIDFDEREVNNVFRIGKKKPIDKPRPTLVSFANEWKKNVVMKLKKNFKDVYITEDYTKEVLEKRKMLLPQLLEERSKGNIAYLKYDKIIIKGKSVINSNKNDNRQKRKTSTSPETNQPRKQQTLMPPNNKILNAYDLLRTRRNSLPSITTDNKQ